VREDVSVEVLSVPLAQDTVTEVNVVYSNAIPELAIVEVFSQEVEHLPRHLCVSSLELLSNDKISDESKDG
jgi:hypothetical protein